MLALGGYGIGLCLCMMGFFLWKKGRIKGTYSGLFLPGAIIFFICLLVALWELLAAEEIDVSQLLRGEAGQGSQQVELILDAEGVLSDYAVTLEIWEQQLTEEELEEVFDAAKEELEETLLGGNVSLEEVSSALVLPGQLQDGMVTVSLEFYPYGVIGTDGVISWEKAEEKGYLILALAELTCQKQSITYEFYLQLVEPVEEEDPAEVLLAEIEESLTKENETRGEAYLTLPQEIGGVLLNWKQEKTSYHGKLLLLGSIGMVLWVICQREKVNRAKKKREEGLRMDYPELVSRLSLLTGAGMTVSAAWGRMVRDYQGQKEEERPGFGEMELTWHEMQDGVGELRAYENFGRRCNQTQYRRLAALLMQNLRKGSKGMQELLDGEVREAREERKAYARQRGEEAGTKLLIPMGMMLILVFAILMMPAMLSLGV